MFKHRPDIEGLRALAVVLVIFYHYQFPGIPGGFIGVDVFFVISGFVITQLLQRSLSDQTFTFSAFYARRIRRLVPSGLREANSIHAGSVAAVEEPSALAFGGQPPSLAGHAGGEECH